MKFLLFLSLVSFVGTFNVEAIDKVVYGTDNRLDVVDHPNEVYREWAKSTAVRVPNYTLEIKENNFSYKKQTLVESFNTCSKERFTDQPEIGECSGFLVAEDILVTAGHCVKSQLDCDNNVWIFDYVKGNLADNIIQAKDLFRCKEVLFQKLDSSDKMDFAVIKLDRKTDRLPLKFRTEGVVENETPLVVIGYPSGLPAKIDDGGVVKKNDNNVFFLADLDTFGGNSGSPVFNAKTGEVEGILVRGAIDYISDPELKCKLVNVCSELSDSPTCDGEGVTRIIHLNLNKYISGQYLNEERPESPFISSTPTSSISIMGLLLNKQGPENQENQMLKKALLRL